VQRDHGEASLPSCLLFGLRWHGDGVLANRNAASRQAAFTATICSRNVALSRANSFANKADPIVKESTPNAARASICTGEIIEPATTRRRPATASRAAARTRSSARSSEGHDRSVSGLLYASELAHRF
jgi:hypothetical protein